MNVHYRLKEKVPRQTYVFQPNFQNLYQNGSYFSAWIQLTDCFTGLIVAESVSHRLASTSQFSRPGHVPKKAIMTRDHPCVVPAESRLRFSLPWGQDDCSRSRHLICLPARRKKAKSGGRQVRGAGKATTFTWHLNKVSILLTKEERRMGVIMATSHVCKYADPFLWDQEKKESRHSRFQNFPLDSQCTAQELQ